MIRLVAGLARSLPLVLALAFLALAVYAFMAWWKTPMRAKEVMIKVFLVVCSAIAAASLLVSGYALLDHNTPVLELAVSCAVVGVAGLGVTLICRAIFRKHHPHYRSEATRKARVEGGKGKPGNPGAPDMLDVVTRILNRINDMRHRGR